MKKTLIFSIVLVSTLLRAQGNVGVATTKPRNNLDVNGDINIGQKLYLDSGTGTGTLVAGNEDQVLVSQGPNKPPKWKTFRIPEYLTNKYYLIFNDSFRDLNTAAGTNQGPSGTIGQGATFTNAETATSIVPATDFVQDTPLTALTVAGKNFKSIAGLSQNFTVNSTQNSTYLLFETVVQQNNAGGDGSNIKFACGIFVDGLLKSIRINRITPSPNSSTFITHTQIGGVENLAPGTHSVGVACSRLSNPVSGLTLGIGVPASTSVSNLNNFMTQSSLKVDVYEIPQNFSPIVNP